MIFLIIKIGLKTLIFFKRGVLFQLIADRWWDWDRSGDYFSLCPVSKLPVYAQKLRSIYFITKFKRRKLWITLQRLKAFTLFQSWRPRRGNFFYFRRKHKKEIKFLKIDFLLQLNKAMKLILTKALGTCEKFSAEINEENLIDSWEKVDLEISRVSGAWE